MLRNNFLSRFPKNIKILVFQIKMFYHLASEFSDVYRQLPQLHGSSHASSGFFEKFLRPLLSPGVSRTDNIKKWSIMHINDYNYLIADSTWEVISANAIAHSLMMWFACVLLISAQRADPHVRWKLFVRRKSRNTANFVTGLRFRTLERFGVNFGLTISRIETKWSLDRPNIALNSLGRE